MVNILVRRSTAVRADVRSRARGGARRGRRRVSGRLARGDRGSEYSDIRSQMVQALHPRSRGENASRTRTTEK